MCCNRLCGCTVVLWLGAFVFELSALVVELGSLVVGLIAILVDLSLNLYVELVSSNELFYCSVAASFCHCVGWIVTAVNPLDVYELASLVGFTHGHDVNYEALLFGGAKLDKAIVQQLRVGAHHNGNFG
jgi:hypothetical protein